MLALGGICCSASMVWWMEELKGQRSRRVYILLVPGSSRYTIVVLVSGSSENNRLQYLSACLGVAYDVAGTRGSVEQSFKSYKELSGICTPATRCSAHHFIHRDQIGRHLTLHCMDEILRDSLDDEPYCKWTCLSIQNQAPARWRPPNHTDTVDTTDTTDPGAAWLILMIPSAKQNQFMLYAVLGVHEQIHVNSQRFGTA